MKDEKTKVTEQIMSKPADSFGERFPVLISKSFTLAGVPTVFRSDPLPPGLIVIGFGLVNHYSDLGDVEFDVGTISDPQGGILDWSTAKPLGPHFLNLNGSPRPIELPNGGSIKLYNLKFPLVNPDQCLAVQCFAKPGCRIIFSLYLVCSGLSEPHRSNLLDQPSPVSP